MTTQNKILLRKLPQPHSCFIVDLAYAGTKNAFYRDMYSEHGITECYMHPDMYEKLMRLAPELTARRLKMVIYDIFRPWAVQKFMYESAPDCLRPYIAPPPEPDSTDGFHPRAAAIDCYLADENGAPLVFPTEPDAFLPGWENRPDYENYLAKCHRSYNEADVSPEAYKNRQLLEDLMTGVGFEPEPTEWWHFNLPNATQYPIIYSLNEAEVV